MVKTFYSVSSCLVSYVTFCVHGSSHFAADYFTFHGFLFVQFFKQFGVELGEVIRLPIMSCKDWPLVTFDWSVDRGIISESIKGEQGVGRDGRRSGGCGWGRRCKP